METRKYTNHGSEVGELEPIQFSAPLFGDVSLTHFIVEKTGADESVVEVNRWFAGEGDHRKGSPSARISEEMFSRLIGRTFRVGNEATTLTHQTKRPENSRGKVADGPYQDRLGDSSVIIDHDGREVRVILSAIREKDSETGMLKPSYLVTVEGREVLKSGGSGRTAMPTITEESELDGLFS